MRFTIRNKHTPPAENRERRRAQLQPGPGTKGSVFSYHAARSLQARTNDERSPVADTPPRRKSLKALRRLRTARTMSVAVLTLLLVIVSLNLDSRPRVTLIGGPGHIFLRPTAVYTQAAQQLFARSALNHNKITVNTAQIAAAFQRQFPEIDAASIRLPLLGNQPVLYVQPAIPQLILDTQSNGAFVLDDNGRALLHADSVPGVSQLDLPTVVDQSGITVTPGKIALPAATVDFIGQVAGQLKAAGLQLAQLTLPAGTSELDVRVSGAGYFIKFNLEGKARAEAGTFLAVRQYLTSQHVVPGQYVDVRVPGRAYYK